MQVSRRITSLLDWCPGHELVQNMHALSERFHAGPMDENHQIKGRMWVVAGKKFDHPPPRSAFEDHEDEDAGIGSTS